MANLRDYPAFESLLEYLGFYKSEVRPEPSLFKQSKFKVNWFFDHMDPQD